MAIGRLLDQTTTMEAPVEAITDAASRGGRVFEVGALGERLAALTDGRQAGGKRYPLARVLLLVVLAKLSGEDRPSGIADWVAHRQAALHAALGLTWRRMPHHNTFRRVLHRRWTRGSWTRSWGRSCVPSRGLAGASW